MLKYLGDALRTMAMEKDAKKKLKARREAAANTASATYIDAPKQNVRRGMTPARHESIHETAIETLRATRIDTTRQNAQPARQEAIRETPTEATPARPTTEPKTSGQREMTPERQELIRQAMEVQRAQAKILDDLKDEDKQKLYALALKTLLGVEPDADDGKK